MEAKYVDNISSVDFSESSSQSDSEPEAKIITVIPAYNEEQRISRVIKECYEFSDKVIVIDDGSSDATSYVASETGALVVKHKRNSGKGSAIRTAISVLKNFPAKVVVLIDADGQDNPVFIPKLVEPVLRGKADLVIGSRFTSGGLAGVPKHKIIGNRILTFFTNLFSGFSYRLKESQCGYRAIKRDIFLDLNLRGNGFEVDSEILLEAFKLKLRILEVPIKDKVVLEAIEKGTTILDGIKVVLSLFHLSMQKLLSSNS